MSEENVQLLRRWFEGFNARDIEAVIAVCDPNGVFTSTFAVGGAAVYHGHDGVRRYFGDLAEAWGDEIRLEPEAYFDLGEHTVAFGVSRGRGRQSGAEVAMPFASVARWCDGRIVYLKGYAHREEALRDLGVSEDELEPIAPMSASANLNLVGSIYAATERGDYTWAAWAHPEIEFVIVDGPTPGSWKGIAAMAAGWRDYLSAWEEHRSVTEEYRELDDERVLVFVGVSGRGKTSGLDVGELQARGASLFHVRDAKVTRLVVYFDRERALADLGLAPEDSSR